MDNLLKGQKLELEVIENQSISQIDEEKNVNASTV
jgi:hypothetical protein